MRPLELAEKYMDVVFNGKNPQELHRILADECIFKGPFYEFKSSDGYIDSLLSDPPGEFAYEIIAAFETESSACLVYQFSRPGIRIPMAQLFEISDGKISKILLVFDTAPFA